MKKLTTTVLVLASLNVFGQIGLPDVNFGINGIASVDLNGRDDFYDLKVLPDGKILCLVKHQASGSTDNFPAVCRLNPDGSLDLSYGTNGISVLPGQVFLLDLHYQLDIDSQNRAIVALTEGDAISVYRLLPTGAIDTDFSFDGLVTVDFSLETELLADVEVQPDDRIMVATSTNEGLAVARLNTDGTFDTSFGTNGKQAHGLQGMEQAEDMVIQPNGKILVCGQTDNGFGNWVGIIRMNADGTLDSSFDDDGQQVKIINSNERANAIFLQPDGKILVAGRSIISAFDQRGILLRYNSDGSEDNTFDTDGLLTVNFSGMVDWLVTGLVQPDGKILTGGVYNNDAADMPIWVTRVNSDGTFDTEFSTDGSTTVSLSGMALSTRAMDFTPNGDLIIGASDDQALDGKDIRLVKLTTGLNIGIIELALRTVTVYPNPAIDELNLNLSELESGQKVIQIFDGAGKMVLESTTMQDKFSLDISAFSVGLYTANITTRTEVGAIQFTKIHE